jgi:GT2 family glycosyltransferase
MTALPPLTTSVLVASRGRPASLVRLLHSLGNQTECPDQAIVVWQGNDDETRLAAECQRAKLPFRLDVIHSDAVGIVAAENAALAVATGEIVLLVDDDAVAPVDWLARHLAHFANPQVGAVGGPTDNHRPDGNDFHRRSAEPVGRLTWYGRALGNLYDHETSWRNRAPREVDHLAANNMSLRRAAFDRFEPGLRAYWQMFELDACLQVKARGYRVVCDFSNVMDHYPTSPAYAGGRDGDLQVKIYNAAYNHAFVLAKHTTGVLRVCRALYLSMVGSTGAPGLAACAVSIARHGRPLRELRILVGSWQSGLAGWRAGTLAGIRSRAGDAAFANVVEHRRA